MRKNWVEGVVFEMTLDPFEMTLTGDTSVQWEHNNESYDFKGITVNYGAPHSMLFGRATEQDVGLFRIKQKQKFDLWSLFRNHKVEKLDFSLSETYKRTGVIEGVPLVVGTRIEKEGGFFVDEERFPFKIAVTVVGNPAAFKVTPASYSFSLIKEKKEHREGIIEIRNPNLLQFEVSASSDKIAVGAIENQGGEVVKIPIRTKSSEELAVGSFREQIVVKSSQGSERVIPVYLSVKKELELVERDLYFCKDKDLLEVRAKGDGDYMDMQLKIQFSGYGQQKEVLQRYEYAFFNENRI